MPRPNLSALISKFLFQEGTSDAEKLSLRAEINAEASGAAALAKSEAISTAALDATSKVGTHAASVTAHPASSITNTPSGTIAATTVQAAINELNAEKQPLDPDLTAYANAADAAARRALIGAGEMPAALTVQTGNPNLAAATAIVNPSGDNNSVLYTAPVGAAGNNVSITYATPAASSSTIVAVVASAITVTPGTKARMVVSGVSTAGVNGSLQHVGFFSSSPFDGRYWTDNGLSYAANFGVQAFTLLRLYNSIDEKIELIRYDASGTPVYTSVLEDAFAWPDGQTYPAPTIGTGIPVVTAGNSSAAQVIAAVNASTPASALVTASAVGLSTGAVSAIAAVSLTYGGDLVPATAHGQSLQVLDLGIWYKWDSVNELWVQDGGAVDAPSILTALGIPTYANLAAANHPDTGVGIGKPYYDTALSALNNATA
jgi:hypothetical protein